MTTIRTIIGPVAAATLALGCGNGLVNQEYEGEALTTIHGALATGATQIPTEPISLAILWMPQAFEGGSTRQSGTGRGRGCSSVPMPLTEEVLLEDAWGWVSQSVTYQAEFPISFTIPLNELPPASARMALEDYGGSGTISFGVVVAYIDGNGNGVYDRGGPGNLPDELLSSSSNWSGSDLTAILFLDGDPAGFAGAFGPLPQGFSIISRTPTIPPTMLGPMDPIPMTLGHNIDGKDFEYTGCAQIERRISSDGPVPANAEFSCSAEDRYAYWSTPVERPEPCVTVERGGLLCLLHDEQPPADWPCN